MPSSKKGLAPTQNILVNQRDNAWHNTINPKYIEWWYVDVLFANQYQISGSFGIWGNLLRPSSLKIRSDFLLTKPTGEVIDFGKTVSFNQFRASTDKCDVHLGRDYFREIEGQYFLYLKNENNHSISLTILPQCSGFKHIHFFDNEERFFSWVVPVPRAKIICKLQQNDEYFRLNGIGYHDHNWASIEISKELSSWEWGRFHGENTTIIFATVSGRQGMLFGGVAWIEHSVNEHYYKYLNFDDPDLNLHFEETSSGWHLIFVDSNIQLHLNIVKKEMLLSRGGEYKRFFSHAKGKLIRNSNIYDLAGTMIHEFKQL